MSKVKIEIKAAKEFHGHDGQGFDASVYVNGKRSAIVSDDGWGGEYMYDVLDQDRFDLIVPAIADLTWTSPFEGDDQITEHAMTLDIFLCDLVCEALEKKDARGKILTKDSSGTTQLWSGKYKMQSPEFWKEQLAGLIEGEFEIINDILGVRILEGG